jgi:hypothetical protein
MDPDSNRAVMSLAPLQGQADRIKYLQTRQAKIVAMTCTHAALKRREFLDIGFKYDNLLMEESAQILEIESFIPMLLQVPLLQQSRPQHTTYPKFAALNQSRCM